VIEPGEQALLERFGRPVGDRAILSPGAHFKWPWPIDRVYRFRTEQIQSFEVGVAPDNEQAEGRVVLWAKAHTKEENFLVANREPGSLEATNQVTGKRTPPVSFLTGSIPIQYQITNLEAWAYNNEDAPSLLQDVATREIVRYLAGADVNDVLSRGRLAASQALADRIQSAADEHQLGARIVGAGLQDLHPPVKVAPDYEKVVGATQTKRAKILAAMADEIRTNALSGAQAVTIVNRAKAERTAREIGALAQAALFTNQIPAFEAAPSVYAQRAYLQTFARATANSRKYILLTTNTHDVIVFDLQESVARDLLQLNVPAK
jgi:regulator of protease activity HflC (stomatin/prohibitin superfamily)